MFNKKTLFVDNREVAIGEEPNLLEVIRKANIDIPTFCYHSELSVYGACRMCLVEVEGRGLVASCSTAPEQGMHVHTNTEEVRGIRRMALELLLANHDMSCPTCPKNESCKLQDLARRYGIDRVRFKPTHKPQPIDRSTASIVRDPNKCILCGDCVRACTEIQGIGAIDFAFRGSRVAVLPAFGKDLASVECVNCGQCVRVCPTGALTPRSEVAEVWKALNDPSKTVVAQIAPAVRVALGESFGLEPGVVTTGQTVAALKALGFDKVYDTSFAADMTVLEEGTELLKRVTAGERLPQFSSCCPAWVKYAEQYYPSLLSHLSSCKSPQQMFGSIAKETLPKAFGIERKDLVVISIMPCTAKKFEAQRPEFAPNGIRDVDYVLTTQELAHMIDEAGLRFRQLSPESLDLPLGFKTGAGVLFGGSGGVTEAVLRFVYEKLSGVKLEAVDFEDVRGQAGLRTATVTVAGKTLKLAIASGLRNAKVLAEQAKQGTCAYDFVEVMSCPGGCIGGAGQPVTFEDAVRIRRAQGLYEADKTLELHKSQDNPYVAQCYTETLGEIGGDRAEHLLHTSYQSRRRIDHERLPVITNTTQQEAVIKVAVCVGTSCYVKGSQEILRKLVHEIEEHDLRDRVDVKATFCFECCDQGPTVSIDGTVYRHCTFEGVRDHIYEALRKVTVS